MLQVQPQYSLRAEWEALAQQESLDYEVLELSFPTETDTPAWQKEVERWYAACGRVNSIHGAFIDLNPASNDSLIREVSRMRCRQSCETAQKLGADYLVLHGGAFPFLNEDSYIEPWAVSSAAFYESLAAEYGLHICVENSQDIAPLALRRMMEKVTDPRVRICLDIGHVNYGRAPLEEWFGQLGPWIGYLHLSDNTGMYDNHIAMGTGTVDWAKADWLWRGLGSPDIPMTFEVGGLPDVRASLAFLHQHHYFGVE